MKTIYLTALLLFSGLRSVFSQNFTEILGRPTNNSITMSILFDTTAQVYWEYGTTTGNYTSTTATYTAGKDTSRMVDLTGLTTNKKYYYRTRYRTLGATTAYLAGPERTFHTPRPAGNSFSFAIEADPHLDTNSNPSSYSLTLQNILGKCPDFLIDLGDIFMSEKLAVVNQTNITARHLLYRPYFGATCHSVPLYLVIGNHEGELGWQLNGTATSMPVMTSNTRKIFYPNPLPNSFYTGDTIAENFVGLRGNYYAWEWGNALFVVLDPYWYTLTKPGWGWTLGAAQYNWFKKTITQSTAKFKFVFCHQLVGGNGNDGRGGAEFVDFFEMGGENADTTYGFTTNRPGWGDPVHKLMKDNGVNVFFHGHDHFFGKQDKDGIVYQEVPQPSNRNISNTSAAQYGYVNGVILPGRGYLLVTVSDSTAKVDYIKTLLPNEVTSGHNNAEIGYTYTLSANTAAVEEYIKQSSFQISQNYPNPFSLETNIKYYLQKSDRVQLKVYDMYGREVATLVDKLQDAGAYNVALNSDDLSLKSGIYYFRINVGNSSRSMKMICIK